MPIQTSHPMIFLTSVSFVTLLLLLAGSFLIMTRVQKWHTLLMTVGAAFSLIVRIISTTIGYLEVSGRISTATYSGTTDITMPLGLIGNLCFAIGMAAFGLHLYRVLPDIAKAARYVHLAQQR
jgi:Na+-transporting NADH:ubiquinone oxidoreductase subunit NqrB